MNTEERFLGRFDAEFALGSLANVKFFVRAERVSATDLIDEINRFEDAVAAHDCRIVESIDAKATRIRYDAPFQ